MYIPDDNQMNDQIEIVDFMKRFSFALIITSKDNVPTATHLPFLVRVEDDEIVLTSHFAKENPQWKDLVDNTALIVFSEPHAYISPKLYDKTLNVPTWNYLAVHAYGKAKIISESDAVMAVLNATVTNYEMGYKAQWERLPEQYKVNLAKGIVAFEIVVTDLQAKKKISQNKTESEQQNIINSLSESDDSNARLIAEYMRKNQES
jgi:transcriptional regulator